MAAMQVPAVGPTAVRNTLEEAFGKTVEELFDDFEFEPIAAASLGQVHLATLNGRRVVVKVQRPGLRELFRVDLKNVRVIAQWLQVLLPHPLQFSPRTAVGLLASVYGPRPLLRSLGGWYLNRRQQWWVGAGISGRLCCCLAVV